MPYSSVKNYDAAVVVKTTYDGLCGQLFFSRAIPERLGFKLDAILENNFINFVTQDIIDGALYSCTDIKKLPALAVQFFK